MHTKVGQSKAEIICFFINIVYITTLVGKKIHVQSIILTVSDNHDNAEKSWFSTLLPGILMLPVCSHVFFFFIHSLHIQNRYTIRHNVVAKTQMKETSTRA